MTAPSKGHLEVVAKTPAKSHSSFTSSYTSSYSSETTATCHMPDFGTITLTQTRGRPIRITADFTGLSAGEHGMHVHTYGDLSDGCASTGGHYNPRDTEGGIWTDDISIRNVGEIKPATAGWDGRAHYDYSDPYVSLFGNESVLGRAIVIHANPEPSAGPRLDCCVIGLPNPDHATASPTAPAPVAHHHPEPVVKEPVVGGRGPYGALDTQAQTIINEIRSDVEKGFGVTFKTWSPTEVSTQVVSGKNYKYTVQTEYGFLEVLVHQPLPWTNKGPELTSVNWKH